jgi:hypothetical protein
MVLLPSVIKPVGGDEVTRSLAEDPIVIVWQARLVR